MVSQCWNWPPLEKFVSILYHFWMLWYFEFVTVKYLQMNLHSWSECLHWLVLQIKFELAGWIENPIKSVVLTFPIDKIVFPTVTLCPRDSRPDRWGTAIKIFDQLNTDCGPKRWDSVFKSKANEIMLNSLLRSKREKIVS